MPASRGSDTIHRWSCSEEAIAEMKRLRPPLAASCLLLAYGAAAAWSGRVCRRDPAAAPPWARRWLCDEEELAQRAYAQLWEGPQGRRAAAAALELIVARDPASPRRWCDLGDAWLEAGDVRRASNCFTQAIGRAPHSPLIRLRAANFYFRAGDAESALRQTAQVLRGGNIYDEVVFSSYTRFAAGIGQILDHGLPEDRRAARAYLRYLLEQNDLERARAVWKWMGARSLADDPLAAAYTAALLKGGAAGEAAAAWSAYLGPRGRGYRETNLVFNGGFESDFTGCELDWTIEPVKAVEAARDHETSHDGTASLRLRFDGAGNVDYHHAWQTVVIEPGLYRLEAWLRVDGISTDQGVGLRIFDPQAPQRLDVRTAHLTGTAPWTQVEITFRAPDAARLVVVQVTRARSRKIDGKIRGAAWIDGVVLRRTG
jgi:tetratricopeptide (TPR) repeat protein